MISTTSKASNKKERLVELIFFFGVFATSTAGGIRLSLPSARSATAEWRVHRKVNVLLRVQSHHEGWDVDELLSDPDVTVTDHDTGVVHRLGEAELEHLCLETSLKEVFGLQVKDEIKLHLVFVEDAVPDKTSEECVAFEETLRVLLVEGQQLTGSLSHLGETVLHPPDLGTKKKQQQQKKGETKVLEEGLCGVLWHIR